MELLFSGQLYYAGLKLHEMPSEMRCKEKEVRRDLRNVNVCLIQENNGLLSTL